MRYAFAVQTIGRSTIRPRASLQPTTIITTTKFVRQNLWSIWCLVLLDTHMDDRAFDS